MTVYQCVNRRCGEYRKEFTAMDIRDAKVALGHGILCSKCGDVVRYIRPADTTPAEVKTTT